MSWYLLPRIFAQVDETNYVFLEITMITQLMLLEAGWYVNTWFGRKAKDGGRATPRCLENELVDSSKNQRPIINTIY